MLPSNPTVKGRSTGAHFRVLICSSATPPYSLRSQPNWGRAGLSLEPGPPVSLSSYFGQPSWLTGIADADCESFRDGGATPPVGTNQTSTRRYFALASLSFTVWPLNSPVFGMAEVPQK